MSTLTEHGRKTTLLPPTPPDFSARQAPVIRLYPVANYKFGVKDLQPEEDPSVPARLHRLQTQYEADGMRRTCEAVLLCHEHGHPYILMLQIANTFFKLPGDYIRPDEDELEGFKTRLNEKLAPPSSSESSDIVDDWQIGDCLAQWWRPNFEIHMYPFIPPHVTRPKECKKMYLVPLPRQKELSVPRNMKLLAVPLFELYDNPSRYGSQLAAIPLYLSRYRFEFVDHDDNVIGSYTPGASYTGEAKSFEITSGDAAASNETNV